MLQEATQQRADLQELYARGRVAFDNEQWADALPNFQQVLELDPGHAMANYHVGEIVRRAGNSPMARPFFARAATALHAEAVDAPGDQELWLKLLCALAGAGDKANLAAVLRQARAQIVDDPWFLHNVGAQLVNAGEVALGVGLLEEALAAGLDQPVLLKNLAMALAKIGRDSEALTDFQQAQAQRPDDVEVYDGLASMYGHSNLHADKAADCLRQALAIAPNPQRYAQLAERLRLHARFDEAIEVLREALARADAMDDITRADLLAALGNNLELAQQSAQAQATWQQALDGCSVTEADGGTLNVAAACRRTRLLWRLGRRDEAREVLRQLKAQWAPRPLNYPPDQYSQDMPDALDRLRAVIAGRDVFVLMHGPSVRQLDERISEFAGADVCFMTAHSFAFFEAGMLARIGRQVELAMVSNAMVLRAHADQVREFLVRPQDNLLLTSRFCFDLAGEGDVGSWDAEAAFAGKLLFFPPPEWALLPHPGSPLQMPLCNTLSCMLPFLVLGGAARVFLFGVDGVGRDGRDGHQRYGAGDGAYRYTPSGDAEAQMLSRTTLVDTLTFGFAAEIGLEATALLHELPIPPVYTVSPQSHIDLFPRIDVDHCLRLLRQPADGPRPGR